MPGKYKVLVIDDEESMRAGCLQALEQEGYRARAAESGAAGLSLLGDESFDIVILDMKMPGMDGMQVLKEIRGLDSGIVVIVITGYATVESAVEAMKEGAYDFLPKPFTPESLIAIVDRAADRKRLALENTLLRRELDQRMGDDTIIGCSRAMAKIAAMVERVAPTDSTVLIEGETGVGKELVARALHRHSPRSDRPFVVVDCGALVETLFESELFGHVKGSFTGAVETTHGKFELADGGTIFLDEIGNVGLDIQAKLLRIVQEREVMKIGGTRSVAVDVRIIAATNRDLAREAKEGRFREDLFYRLSVLPIHIPPLRDRREDIPVLARFFLEKLSLKKKRHVIAISPASMSALEAYDWPGNVRELHNAIERAVVMADSDTIEPGDLLYYGLAHNAPPELAAAGRLAEVEKREIAKALEQFEGHKSKAAEFLGINRKTLREKMRKYEIES